MFKIIIIGLLVVIVVQYNRGRKEMVDKLDTLAERLRGQTTVIAGLQSIQEAFKAANDTLRQQVATLTTELGEAADDNDQLTAINATLDQNDALLASLSTSAVQGALVENTGAADETT